LPKAVESVWAQSFQDIEIILALNNADSETHAEADRLGADPRVRSVRTNDSTASAARNRGLEVAASDWIAFLDDDDLSMPNKLEVQLAAARQTGADLVTCNFMLFGEAGDIESPGLSARPHGLSFPEALMLGNYVSGGSAALVTLAALRRLGGFDDQIVAVEDWDMWRRLSWDHDIHFVDQVLVKYRRHHANIGSDPALVLAGESVHFGKMLRDTPGRFHHMLPEAKRRYFDRITNTLAAEGSIAAHEREKMETILRSRWWKLTQPMRMLSRTAQSTLRRWNGP
jgi:glycosyltransferase involved in cell wall biosynthesis